MTEPEPEALRADETARSTRRFRFRLLGYGAMRSLVEGLFAGRGLALAAVLGAELFGIWALFRLGLRYAAFAGLGSLRGLEVQGSRALARRNPRAAGSWARAVVAYTLLVHGALSVVLALAAALIPDPTLRLVFAGLALALLVNRLWMYGLGYLRVSRGLRDFAMLELTNAGLQLLLAVGLASVWGIEGALVGFALAHLIGLLALRGRVPLRPGWSARRIRLLIRIGLPVSLAGILTATLVTVDRLVVGAFLGIEALGLYAFAIAISELGISLALVVRTVILRDVYGARPGDRRGPEQPKLLDRSLRGFAVVVPTLAGLLALAIGPAIGRFMPDYSAAVPVAQLFLFTGTLQGLANLAILGIVVAGRQARLPLVGAAGLALNLTLAVAAIHAGTGLVGVACASFLSRALYLMALLLLMRPDPAAGTPVRGASAVLGPTLWCLAAALTAMALVPADDLSAVMLSAVVYVIMLVPLARPLSTLLRAAFPSGAPRKEVFDDAHAPARDEHP